MFPPFADLQREPWETARKAWVAPERARQMADAPVGETPYEVVYTENKVELRHYEPTERRYETPVLLTYATVLRPSVLDLHPEYSVVREFLDEGFDVYLLDWGDPSRLDAALTIDDYVTRYLANCVDAARERADADAVHLIGYSTSTPLCVAYAALNPETVATLGLMGPVLDFDTAEGFFSFREMFEHHDPESIVDAFGRFPAPLIDAAFSLRKPIEYAVSNPLRLWDNVEDKEYVERSARKRQWAADDTDMAGGVYRGFADDLLRDNALLEGDLVLGGERVDLANVEMPVLLIVGTEDKFVPPESYRPFLDAVGSDDATDVEFPTGHVGISVAPEAHEEHWPGVREWFAERSAEK